MRGVAYPEEGEHQKRRAAEDKGQQTSQNVSRQNFGKKKSNIMRLLLKFVQIIGIFLVGLFCVSTQGAVHVVQPTLSVYCLPNSEWQAWASGVGEELELEE